MRLQQLRLTCPCNLTCLPGAFQDPTLGAFPGAPNLQYLHEMTSSVGNFLMCRRRDCLYYSTSANWVNSADKEWFMCPACGNKCSPWGEQPGPHLWTA